MTKIERKRAKSIESTLCICNSIITGINRLMILTAILVAIIDTAIFCLMLKDNELYAVVGMHITFMYMFSAMFVSLSTVTIGDRCFIKDIGNRTFGGSYYQGKFISALPFEAKDLTNLRLINCEAQIFTMTLTTALIMAAVFIAGKLGYHDYSGIVGLNVLIVPVLEIVLITVNLFLKRWYIGMIGSMFLSMAPIFTMLGCSDESGETSVELALQFNERLKGFGIMSGISGIIILAVISAAAAAAAELLVHRMSKRSWNIK